MSKGKTLNVRPSLPAPRLSSTSTQQVGFVSSLRFRAGGLLHGFFGGTAACVGSAEADAQSLQHSALFCTGEASTAVADAQQNSECAQDAPAQPAVDEAPPVDVSTPNPVAESAGFDLDILQQVADTVFESLEVFLPQEVADQLRGRSIIVLLALVAFAGMLLAGKFSNLKNTCSLDRCFEG